MALLFADGMDTYATVVANTGFRGWTNESASSSALLSSATSGRFGGGVLYGSAYSSLAVTSYFRFTRAVPIVDNVPIYTHISYMGSLIGVAGTNLSIFRVNTNGGYATILQILPSGQVQVLSPTGTVLFTSTTSLTSGVYASLELLMNWTTTSAGTMQLWIDGVLQGTFNGATISTSAYLPIRFAYGATYTIQVSGGPSSNSYFDDIVIADTTGSSMNTFPLGPIRIGTKFPTADSTPLQWTPSTGTTHYNRVNISWNDATFVSDTGSGNSDLYATTALAWAPGTVHAVQGSWYAQTPSGARTINTMIKANGVLFTDTPKTLSIGAYSVYSSLLYKDPTGVAWTSATASALLMGQGD